jgi:heme-degrading monooxygenase HmoA
MIARVWRCIATDENVSRYVEHFEKSVFPELKQLQGFKEAYILRHNVADGIEITVMTLWESMDAIRSFAGDTLDNAVVEPAAQALLKSFDRKVIHHEIIQHYD